MADEYGESRSKRTDEQMQRRAAILDLDELLLLRSIHGKLDSSRPSSRQRAAASVGGFIC
jgi:hypothetical protein